MLGYKFKGLTAINRRKDRRHIVLVPGKANDQPVLIKDVSLGGLSFTTSRIKLEVGDEVLIDLDVLGLGDVAIGASIVRIRDEHEYGAAFIGLSSDAFRLIEALELGRDRRPVLKVA
jgi:PilZ domain